LPAIRASPWRNVTERSIRLGGTNEKAALANAASASEFSRMSTRLSAEQRGQRGIFLAVGDGVQPEQRGLCRRIDLRRVQPQPSSARSLGGIDGHSARCLLVALGQRRVGVGPDLAQAHEV
jgi:hypothetical protein